MANLLKSDTLGSIASALFLTTLATLPLVLVVIAAHSQHPKERPLTLEEQYPDPHLGI